ncbi:MAG: glutamate--cysteine ligase [Planctomycetes bacterium]|nr:glutamate--cysteine ligase [Planctomycetota bacterium]
MSAPPQTTGTPITDQRQLVSYLEAGCKPPGAWRIGTEHEKFAYTREDLRPLPYEGPRGIRALLEGLVARFGWEPVLEAGKPIALTKDGCGVTLEPGGQFELSGAPLETLHETCDEVHVHLAQVKEIAEPLDIGLVGLGFLPKWRREDVPWMPKGRYQIMRAYMPTKGNLGLDMMLRTCTVQVNLDFESEADMVKKFRTGLALQPIATGLFANSPFTEGKPNGFMSYRSHIWTDADPDRCGILPFVFEDGMGFERYAEHVLDVPMYFVYRDGVYLDASGQSFRDFLDGPDILNESWGIDNVQVSVTPCVEVDIDIKPGSDPNSINLKSKGMIPVAILTTDDFFAPFVDEKTILFGDPEAVFANDGSAVRPVRVREEDVDDDGDTDLLLFFSTKELVANGALDELSTWALLTGNVLDGPAIIGQDLVRIVPNR